MRNSRTPDREDSPEKSLIERHPSKTIAPTVPLPNHIGEGIEAIVELHTSAERVVPRHQRVVEAMTTFFGRPAFLYITLLVVVLWMLSNVLPQPWSLAPFDPPPFNWLEFAIGVGSLLMTIAVLIKQNRQEKLAEQRAQLSIQLNLLSEQKIAKLIALVEELRRDLPNVQNRHDPETEGMQQAVDPRMVVNALEERLSEELIELQKQEASQLPG